MSFLSRFLRSADTDASAPPARPPGESPADDPLALFEAEADAPAPPSPRRAAPVVVETAALTPPAPAPVPTPSSPLPAPTLPAAGAIPLDAIVARRVPVLWPEAVAVILAACDRLAPADRPERQAPDLAGIRIHADGTVDASDGISGEPSVARLARTLHTLLPAQSTPAPLRLLITKWIDTPDAHTIQTFAKELSYFARPDGDALVRALYERCVAALQAAVTPVPEQPERPRLPDAAMPKPPARTALPRWLLPAAAVLAATAALGVWLATQQGSIIVDGPAAAVTIATADAVTTNVPAADVVPSGDTTPQVGTAGTMLAESRPLPGAPRRLTDIVLSPARRTSTSTSTAAATSSAPAAARSAASGARTGDPLPSAAGLDPLLTPVPALRSTPGESPFTSAAAPRGALAVPDRIYTRMDAAVEPPQLVYPQLAVPPDNPGPDIAINTMEVVVGADGRVQTAHLISAPQRMTDMQLLSAAKVWRFEPAVLNGTPVRYRMRVSWATTP